ncbi:HD-GYP domain-containing protein [Cohnella endophytica]|uniref:HD-GYP domain-containing protein n=1 Tax=Cohnella endophytica TaxID=2419778 RepID=A0A494XJA5_9BACL|nr:HD-GYP domain-containing protein [Cohnella endophytica]RKP49842.1 HD-GYP domain-containing protein [Cohnella endophytica]
MRNEWDRCKEGKAFCPGALDKYAMLLWPVFILSAVAATLINWYSDSALLLSLYATPVVLLALLHLTNGRFVLVAICLLGSIYFIKPIDPALIAVTVSYVVLMLIVRRVVSISERHYSGKNAQEDMLMNTVYSLAKTIDARDPYTAVHSSNVANYARSIAKEMGLSQKETDSIYLAGLIHDIGKIGTPDHILQKESRLTEEEYEIMKEHSENGYEIIKNMERLQELGIAAMVRHHHERPDGKGYPAGLQGEAIPLGARILGVADAYDAMTTNRSYRQKLAIETAAGELRKHSGTQFDPAATSALLTVLIREDKLQPEKRGIFTPQASFVNA